MHGSVWQYTVMARKTVPSLYGASLDAGRHGGSTAGRGVQLGNQLGCLLLLRVDIDEAEQERYWVFSKGPQVALQD